MIGHNTLFIIRGCSGAGKSTLAEFLAKIIEDSFNTVEICEADSYFTTYKLGFQDQPLYEFDPDKLHLAHKACQEKCEQAMEWGNTVIVSNTSTKEKDLKTYLDLAKKHSYTVVSLIVENRSNTKSIHNVPEETLKRQEQSLKGSIKLL